MEPVTHEQLLESFSRLPVCLDGIGHDLAFTSPARRTLVLHFADQAPCERMSAVLSIVLDMEEEWFLIPRQGSMADMGLPDSGHECVALRLQGSDRSFLANCLSTTSPDSPGARPGALFVVAGSGDTVIDWDRQARQALRIGFQRVEDAGYALLSLNELGAELDLHCTCPRHPDS